MPVAGTNLDALIASGPAGGTTGKYIGVPDDYVAPTIQDRLPNSVGTPGVAAQPFQLYKEGDQYSVGLGKSAADIAEMQQDLMAAGLIAKGQKFQIGVWDGVTSAAYKKGLEFANQQGLQAGEAIDTLKNAPQYDTSEQKTLQYQLPDRNDVKAIFGKASKSVLGRQLDDSSKDAMAQAYEQKLMEIQQKNFQQQAIDGAKLYDAPDAATFAEQQIRAKNPGEAQAHDYSNVYDEFSQLISNSANGAQTGTAL